MSNAPGQPRILFVTPEVSFVPVSHKKTSGYLSCKSDGFNGFLSGFIIDLYERGVDVHITQPDYRNVFSDIFPNSSCINGCRMPQNRVHLTRDRVFFYARVPASNTMQENMKISLAFQREIIYQILPLVQPDLIHCHDWMSGLIPAMAKKSGIPCVFSMQRCETANCTLSAVEDTGIDAASFWQHLFFDSFPANYEDTRETNTLDLLLSGIFAAQHISIANPALLLRIAESLLRFPDALLREFFSEKLAVDCNELIDHYSARRHYVELYENVLHRPLIENKKENYAFHSNYLAIGKKKNRSYKKGLDGSDNFNPRLLPVHQVSSYA